MRMFFERNSQSEADELRRLLETTIETEKAGTRFSGRDVKLFNITASAELREHQEYPYQEPKRTWRYVVMLEALSGVGEGEGDGGEIAARWRRLFEKLIKRPAIKAGTRVRGVPMFVTGEQLSQMLPEGESLDPNSGVASYFVKTLARGSFYDSEGRRAKHQETISFEVVAVADGWTIVVDCDAIDAPLVAEVMQAMLKDVQRDLEHRAEKAAREALRVKGSGNPNAEA